MSVYKVALNFSTLQIFQLFYYLNGRLSLTNGLLPVLDGETPPDVKKISLKRLYEFFKDTKSHRLLSQKFLSALNLFFWGSIENSRNTINELYQNLAFQTLSGAREIQFEWISDLVLHITYRLQHSILLKKDSDTKKYNDLVIEKYDFDEKPSVDDKFEEQIVTNILDDVPYDHIKTEELYTEPTVQDAQTMTK